MTTIGTYVQTKRFSAKHSAKQSITQMVIEDQINWELFRRFPTNYGNIENEYEIYHKNGGNGEVTKRVNEYKQWYAENEANMWMMRDYKCKPEIRFTCEEGEACKKPMSRKEEK